MTLSGIGPVVLVGAGKMGMALARGWLKAGLTPSELVLVDPNPAESVRDFAAESGVRLLDNPAGVLVHVLVLAVKPQIMGKVFEQLRPSVGMHTLVISIAAGINLNAIARGLSTERVIRTMPNTPAQIGKGVTGAVALKVSDDDKRLADALMRAAGEVMWFDAEAKLDAVTAVSGSGPAYVFHMVEALAEAARRQGFSDDQAMVLARATVIGAAGLLESEGVSATVLRQNVTSPNGTTQAALDVLMGDDGLVRLMDRTVAAARQRSEELGRE